MSATTANPTARQAIAYAGRGWPVMPVWWPEPGGRCGCRQADCGNVAKHPIAALVPHGLKQASTAAETARSWWAAYPRANVGVRTGAASGLVVLDVDGLDGAAALRELVDRHGRFDALWAQTGSGGWHAYLAHPGGTLSNSAKRLGPGLDIRADGGYVVAPPSLHASGARYQWADATNETSTLPALEVPPPMPAWLAEMAKPAAPAQMLSQPVRLRPGATSAYVAAALDGEAQQVAGTPAGKRNARLNVAAYKLGRLVGGGVVDERTVTDTLLHAARAAGLGDREAQATIASGLTAGARNPRLVELDTARRVPRVEHCQEAEAC